MNPFKVIAVYARLYADCLKKSFRGIAKNPWTLLLPMGMSLLFIIGATLLVALLGIVGAFLIGFVIDAFFSAYLYFVAEVVQNSRVSLREWSVAFRAYFWSVMNVFFILYITRLMLSYALATNPHADTIWLGLGAIEFILLSAVPEVLYQRNTYGFGSIMASIEFVQENWIEWFIPHAIVFGLAFLTIPAFNYLMAVSPMGALVGLAAFSIPMAVGMGAFIHVFMVFRGHLFDALAGSTHRQRMFRYRGKES